METDLFEFQAGLLIIRIIKIPSTKKGTPWGGEVAEGKGWQTKKDTCKKVSQISWRVKHLFCKKEPNWNFLKRTSILNRGQIKFKFLKTSLGTERSGTLGRSWNTCSSWKGEANISQTTGWEQTCRWGHILQDRQLPTFRRVCHFAETLATPSPPLLDSCCLWLSWSH